MTATGTLKIENVPIESVRPLKRNPRRGDVDRVRRSIRRWGQYAPIVVRAETGEIVKGNHTWLALREEGHAKIAIVRRSIATDAEAEELAIADNVASDSATWDVPLLAEILAGGEIEIDATLLDPIQVRDIEIDAAAIAASEAGKRLAEQLHDAPVPPTPSKPRTRVGDVIRLGDHVLVCGDSGDSSGAVAAALEAAGADVVDLIVTSPPYNVKVDYGEHDDQTRPWPEYRAWLEGILAAWLPRLGKGRMLAWNIGAAASVHPHRQAVMIEDLGLEFVRQVVWKKVGVPLPKWHVTARNPVARRFTPNPIHELIYLFSNGPIKHGAPLPATDETAQHDVVEIAQNTATQDIPKTDAGRRTGARQSQGLKTRSRSKHPAPFPAKLIAPFITHLAAPGEIVADPFAGAGTVAIVAEQIDRRAVLVEIDPAFCDVAVERWETMTGKKAGRPRRRKPKPAKRKETQ